MVVGLLVVGNIVILVRGRNTGSRKVWWGGGSHRPEVGPRPQVYVLQAQIRKDMDPSCLTLQRERPVLCESSLSVTESSLWIV